MSWLRRSLDNPFAASSDADAASASPSAPSLTSSTTKSTTLRGAIRALKVGFGFIAGDDGTDYFFHWSAMERTGKNFRDLELQERVEFIAIEIEMKGQMKKRAIQVRVLD